MPTPVCYGPLPVVKQKEKSWMFGGKQAKMGSGAPELKDSEMRRSWLIYSVIYVAS